MAAVIRTVARARSNKDGKMAKKDYSESPPAHFSKLFVKSCLNCGYCQWNMRNWYVCTRYYFKLRDHGGPSSHTCGSWELSDELLESWKNIRAR